MNSRICQNCDIEFEIENWELKHLERGKFCSAFCRSKYPRTKEIKKKISEGMKKAISEGRVPGVLKVGTLVRNSGRTRFKKGNISWTEGIKVDRKKYPQMGHLIKHSEETKKKISISGKGRIPWNKGKKVLQITGKNHFAWKGGIYDKDRKIDMGRKNYREWRKAVFARDNCECVWCGSTENLNADHIKSYSLYPELKYEVSNGRVLCESCHKTTDTYGSKLRLLRKEANFASS